MYLQKTVALLAKERDENQCIECTGIFNDEIFHECEKAPEVDLTIKIKDGMIGDDYIAKLSQLEKILYNNHSTWPLVARIPAGLYKIEVTTLATKQIDSDYLKLAPPSRLKELPL
ncbi:hypothetical protein [Pseudomonas viridiflava]|nr:hypothetical protein [Pseudomonas viridiflava]